MREACDRCGVVAFEVVNEAGPHCLTGDFKIVTGAIQNVLCTRCGTVWNRTMMYGRDLRKFYGAYEKKTDAAREDDLLFDPMGGVETLGRNQISFLQRVLPAGGIGRVLDVGCGKGTLLELFAETFPGWERWGVEPSAAAAAIARRHPGLTVLEGMLDRVEVAEAWFDLVTVVHVLEHAASPSATLRAVHRALRPDALLFVEVPNMLDPNMFYDLLLHEHLFHFTPDTLVALLVHCGFDVVTVERSTSYGAQRVVARKARPMPAEATAADAAVLGQLREGAASWRRMWAQMQDTAARLTAEACAGKRVALFGAGMTTAVVLAYTALGHAPIVALIDENPWKVGRTYFGHLIHAPADIGMLAVDVIAIATIPGSQALVRRKLAGILPTRASNRTPSGGPELVCLVEG